MIEKNSSKHTLNCCSYCGWKFPTDFLQDVSKKNYPVFCENCGTEIIKIDSFGESNENTEIDNKIDGNNGKKGFFSRIYETVRNEKNPIERVLKDSDFPNKFKDNLKIVVSRLLFPHIRALESESAQNTEIMELTEVILDDLYEKISPIINQRIKDIFLINLNNISVKEFNKWLKFLQEKIELNKSFHKDFIIYLRWMIKEVFIIISELWDATDIPKFERIIRDDLKFFETFLLCSSSSLPKGILEYIKSLSLNFKDPDLLKEKAIEILIDLITGPNELTVENLPLGYKRNPKYLASTLIYYGLRHEDYNCYHLKYRTYGINNYINDFYPDDNTMKRALTNLPSKMYDFLSDVVKSNVLYFPRGKRDVSEEIRKKVKLVKNMEKNEEFFIDLKKVSRKFCERFEDPDILYNLTLNILSDSFRPPNELNYSELKEKIRYSLPKYYAVGFIYFAVNHKSYKAIPISISSFSDKYFKNFKQSNYSIISNLYKYLSNQMRSKINYSPKDRFDIDIEFDEKLVWEHFSEYLNIFDSSLHDDLYKNARDLYNYAIENGFDPNLLSSKNPKFLALALVFFSLLNSDYEEITKDKLFEMFRENKFEISHTNANEIINIFHRFIEDSLKRTPRRTTDSIFFKDSIENLKKKAQREKRYENVVLYDLILNTLELYKNNFEKFGNDLAFISSQGIKRILERLSNPNVFDKEQYLTKFINEYNKIIKNLNVSSKEKEKLLILLKEFEEKRKRYYTYDEKKSEKREREKERYKKYGEHFFSFKVRVERFLLMLGFSPFDGFDLWGNKIHVKGKYRIYANFHHYCYQPEEQSKRELVFVPIKPPKKIRNGEYLTKNFLSHNSISGLEGNLKRNDISEETRSNIFKKLQRIEAIIEHNSVLLEKAVYTQNHKLLYDLKNWIREDIDGAIDRLKDAKFIWAKNIEKYLPTAEGYDYERISGKETDSIIKEIKNRKR